MIPYIEVYTWRVGPVAFHPFGPLVGIAIVVGWMVAKRRAKHFGYDLEQFASFTRWMTITGFVVAHVFDEITYHPEEVARAPWTLLFIWDGLSSYGGFIGAIIGGFAWKFLEFRKAFRVLNLFDVWLPAVRREWEPVLILGDIYCSTFPVAWIFGRMGCAVVHDHPGARASRDSLLAVAYGPGPVDDYGIFGLHHGIDPRYDLGLLELFVTIVIASAFAISWRKKLPIGTYIVAICVLYAPIRFCLDFLRVEDAEGGDIRYGHLTPAQWMCIAMFVFGAVFSAYVRARARAPKAAIEPAPALSA